MKWANKILIILLIVGTLSRLLWLGAMPTGFFRDEAALGYNAYSIWLTGKDEFGIVLPLIFRSFEVFFLPLYVYLSAPVVGIFGLSEFTSRFVSALSGIVMLYLIYLISKKIWNQKAALFSLGALIVSPWHIIYSRGAFEGNLALTLFAAGFYNLLEYFEKHSTKRFLISMLFFVASIYSYQSERVVAPLLGLIVFIVCFKDLWTQKAKLIFPLLAALIIALPLITMTFKAAGLHRAAGVSVFNKQPQNWIEGAGSDFFTNNKYFLRGKQIAALYFSYLSPRNLFFEGDYNKQRSLEHFSTFYAWMFPFMLSGFWLLIKRSKNEDKFLLTWVFLAPVPAALTGDPFHTYRSLMLYLPLTVLIGVGMDKFLNRVNYLKPYVLGLLTITGISFAFFFYDYTVINPATRARDWDYGYKQIFAYLDKYDYPKIVIDDPWTESYIHYLFFNKIKPGVYHKAVYDLDKPVAYYYQDASEIRPVKVLNYEFRLVDWPQERGESGTVFVFWHEDLPESEYKGDPKVELMKEIKYPDGKTAYRIVKIN